MLITIDAPPSSELGPLRFPTFRRELLRQDWWMPADDLGRIKLILSEGFTRDSTSTPFERVRNIVAFSFQHAPLGVSYSHLSISPMLTAAPRTLGGLVDCLA